MMDPHPPIQPDPPDDQGVQPLDPFEVDFDGPNPYSANQPSVVSSEIVANHPRWWTPLAVCGVSLAVFLLSSLLMTLAAIFVVHGELTREVLRKPDLLSSISESRIGLMMMVIVPQIALVLPALVAATLSPVATRRRLSLVRGHWPLWAWIAAAAATPLVGLTSTVVLGSFVEESDALKEMTQIFRGHGNNGFLIPLALMIGATPAFCEELLFRGYIQTRLSRSFGPVVGILVASSLFAAFHMDVVHVIAVFPLGLFLGWVSWRSGSLFPAMLGHFVNNAISVVAVVLAPEAEPDVLAVPAITLMVSILGAGLLGMTAVLFASIVYREPIPDRSLSHPAPPQLM